MTGVYILFAILFLSRTVNAYIDGKRYAEVKATLKQLQQQRCERR